ncbi:uncharacterized protein C20orf96 homolog isoform X1 [Dipodomys spectabilis]|uniref:uncharacterized protein C20orf96 homolog isoform X1 n=1 Tax=Dipodomys spectabilis TaxID=105255 RepID=UPI001C53B326|nr:uncharacterized protein C20orf96 homolog isoform X1 [Dipodomys spectabilis]
MPTLYRSSHSGTPSTIHLLQKSNQKLKKWVPPLRPAESHNKSKMKTSIRDQQVVPARATLSTSQQKNLTETQGREQPQSWKIQARLRLMRSMVRNERTAFQELCNHEAFLTKFNQDLVKTVRDKEDATALRVRALLQQHQVLGNVINILEYFNKKRVQEMNAELQEWEEKEEQKINCLEQEVQKLNEEISATQEEVKFLSTYMDHEYSVKSVQIANHMRQLQQVKDKQQDKLDNLIEMRKMALDSLCNMIREKEKEILQSLIIKIQQPCETHLWQMAQNSQKMQKSMVFLKDFIEQMKEEMPILADEVKESQSQILDPREIAFEDVLLRRPRCTPDMAVILNIPMEDLLF